MSGLAQLISNGAESAYLTASEYLEEAIEKYGKGEAAGFFESAYPLPVFSAVAGQCEPTLQGLKDSLEAGRNLITHEDSLGSALNAGLAWAISAEILEALRYYEANGPYEEAPALGFVPDSAIRTLGLPLAKRDISGIAILYGAAPTPAEAAEIVHSYLSKGVLSFLCGPIISQLEEAGTKMSWARRAVPLGADIATFTHAISAVVRMALLFGNVAAGDMLGLLAYTKERVPAFVNILGDLGADSLSAAAGAIALGFPTITNADLGEMQVPTILESVPSSRLIVDRSLSLRKIEPAESPIELPVAYSASFEGDAVRSLDMHAEAYYERDSAFELAIVRDAADITDGSVEVLGEEIGEYGPISFDFGLLIEVAGRNMRREYEPVIEKKAHTVLNSMEGVTHAGYRSTLRLRISEEAYRKGLRLSHIGRAVYEAIKQSYSAVAEKCQVTIITDTVKAREILTKVAIPFYESRDERLAALKDERAESFFACRLCESVAVGHCCILSPERPGECGAVNWLEAKLVWEQGNDGRFTQVSKGKAENELFGSYESVDKAFGSHVCLYSIMESPVPSSGLAECISEMDMKVGGAIIANREYEGLTPTGKDYAEMALEMGTESQSPGYLGHSRDFITSKKYLLAEGGIARIVWMPTELKEGLREKLDKAAKEMYGFEAFTDMIADESVATNEAELRTFLRNAGHPALNMDSIAQP